MRIFYCLGGLGKHFFVMRLNKKSFPDIVDFKTEEVLKDFMKIFASVGKIVKRYVGIYS
jgi:hypothetical protein